MQQTINLLIKKSIVVLLFLPCRIVINFSPHRCINFLIIINITAYIMTTNEKVKGIYKFLKIAQPIKS